MAHNVNDDAQDKMYTLSLQGPNTNDFAGKTQLCDSAGKTELYDSAGSKTTFC